MPLRDLRPFLLPALALLVSGLYNTDKLDISVWSFATHSVFQCALLTGVLSLSAPRPVLRSLLAALIVAVLLVQLSYGTPVNLSIAMSVISTSPGEALDFVQSFISSCTPSCHMPKVPDLPHWEYVPILFFWSSRV